MSFCLKTCLYFILPLFVLLLPLEGSHSGQVSASGPDSRSNLNELEWQRPLSITEMRTFENSRSAAYYPKPKLDPIILERGSDGNPAVSLESAETPLSLLGDRVTALSQNQDYVFLSIDEDIQRSTRKLVQEVNAPHAVAVVMNPRSGEILALAQKSKSMGNMYAHRHFPAASLFKIITAAAGLEQSDVTPQSVIRFRGGTYTLNSWNYKADPRRDNRHMTLSEAMGRSCNPVFARVALGHLTPDVLDYYANAFGFNTQLAPQLKLPKSSADIPSKDYDFSRTAAGFGKVYITPVHAAALMSGIANNGIMPRPSIINEVVNAEGKVVYRSQSEVAKRMVHPRTAKSLLDMLEYTTTMGTSKREFVRNGKRVFPTMAVSGKTGTLRGQDPEGIHNWFVGVAPKNNPEIVVATLVIYPGSVSTRASRIARQIMQEYFQS